MNVGNISKAFNIKDNEAPMTTLVDDYRWHTSVWMMRPFSHFYRTIEKFILLCHQGGIIENLQEIHNEDRSVKYVEEPKKLTLKMLSAGFYIWLGSVVVACSVFTGEFITYHAAKNKILVDICNSIKNHISVLRLKVHNLSYVSKKTKQRKYKK